MARKKSRVAVKAVSDKNGVDATTTTEQVDEKKDEDVAHQQVDDDNEDNDDDSPPSPADEKKRKRATPSSAKSTVAPNEGNGKPKATRKRKEVVSSKSADGVEEDETKPAASEEPKETTTSKPRATRKRTPATSSAAASKKKVATAAESKEEDDEQADPEPEQETKPKATKKRGTAAVVQSITTRDELPKLWNPEEALSAHGSYTFKIASWNVAGLRALLRNAPNALPELLKTHDLDVLCLQETKLQESHLEDPQLVEFRDQLSEQGYHIYYSCSVERKGYSGTAVMVRRGNSPAVSATSNGSDQPSEASKKKSKKQTNLKTFFGAKKNEPVEAATEAAATVKKEAPLKSNLPEHVADLFDSAKVSYGMGQTEHDREGRVIVMDFPLFSLCNVYTPNSGQDLKRLSYRVEQWDKDFLSFIQNHSKELQLPILWLGDLNIAHRANDVYNDGAKHLAKQAGVTPQERASFTQQLADSGFVDAFRHLHPTAQGHYTYWSTRAGNRDANKGLRLDYFVCDPVMLEEEKSNVVVRDSYMLPEIKGSDHCPIILELEIKPSSQK